MMTEKKLKKRISYFLVRISYFYKEKRMYGAVAYLKTDQGSAWYTEKRDLFMIRATRLFKILQTTFYGWMTDLKGP